MKDFSCWKESCLKLQVPVLFFQPLSWNYIVMGNRDALLQIIFLSRFSINISWFEFGKCFLCASTAHVNKDTQSSFRFTNDLPVWHGGPLRCDEVWWPSSALRGELGACGMGTSNTYTKRYQNELDWRIIVCFILGLVNQAMLQEFQSLYTWVHKVSAPRSLFPPTPQSHWNPWRFEFMQLFSPWLGRGGNQPSPGIRPALEAKFTWVVRKVST